MLEGDPKRILEVESWYLVKDSSRWGILKGVMHGGARVREIPVVGVALPNFPDGGFGGQHRRRALHQMPPRRTPQLSVTSDTIVQINTSTNQKFATATSATSMTIRKGRGKTKGVYLSKILDKLSKVEVIFPTGGLKPIGNWSAQWGTELGVICRNNAKVTCKKWKHIVKEDKEHIYELIFDKFGMDMDASNVQVSLDLYLQNRFRSYRHELHKHYKEHLPMEQALRRPPTGVSLEDWKECCEQFANEKFQERMIELQKQTHPDGRPFTPNEIGDMVLGTRPGYARGLGYGEPSWPLSALAYRHQANLEDARRRATDAEKSAQELESRIQSQNVEIQSQKERMDAMLMEQSSMRSMMETLMQRIENYSTARARLFSSYYVTLFLQTYVIL